MKKVLALLCAVLVLLANSVKVSVCASYTPENLVITSGDVDVLATGLIYFHSLEVSNSNGQLCINGTTRALTEMKSIGFTDITIEYSSNGTSGWTPVQYPDDILASDTKSCDIYNYKVSVTKGYYYRVTCTHYAKATGLFGKSQSVSNTSNSVKV